VTPAAVGFDKQTNGFRFHNHTLADGQSKINCRLRRNSRASPRHNLG
jgi:hypothetical protein